MRRFCAGSLLLLGSWHLAFARAYQDVPELGLIFKKEGLEGTFVLLDASSDKLFVWNKTGAKSDEFIQRRGPSLLRKLIWPTGISPLITLRRASGT
jgi:hypothetical protein